MKVIILAGGLGTRISEETADKPKPMVEVGGKPILWHVMSIYASYGITDFLIATGYMHQVIERYIHTLKDGWDVQSLYTGENSQTGWRIAKCLEHLDSNEHVLVTYGDGLGNVDISNLIKFHKTQKKLVTVTAVRPPARFGVLEIQSGIVTHFGEKSQADAGWINGGFFVLNPQVKEIVKHESEAFEAHILPMLVPRGELMAYEHQGFWQPMDTLREKNILDEYSRLETPPWLQNDY